MALRGYKKLCPQGHRLVWSYKQKRHRCRRCDVLRHRSYYRKNNIVINAKNRERNLVIRYGVTKRVYAEILVAQNGKCAICKEISKKTLAVDHCHKTGQIRGLLCRACNSMLGFGKDNKSIFENAISYLK